MKGDSLSLGLQMFVCQYSHIQSSKLSSSHSPSSSSHHSHQSQPHGSAIAVTIQFPHISATGDGSLSAIFCGHIHIAIHNCAVSVGAA